jgi:hypothetical protein
LKNRRILILKDKSIGLIKRQKAGLENLLGSPCIKRRIRRRAIRDYQMGEHKNPPYSFYVAPTNLALEWFWGSTITGGNQVFPFNR